MSPPAISVVLPVHNGMPYVRDSVRSILAQDWADFELVAGDDGSDDGTTEALQGLAREDSRLRVLRRAKKSGLAASANWVVSEARAPIIAVAHADDIAHPSRLRRQIEILEAQPDCVLVGAMSVGIDETGREVHPPNLWRLAYPTVFAPMPHSSIMFRRDAFQRAGGYRKEVDYWEDLDLYWRIAEFGDILVIPEVLASYRYSKVSARERGDPAKLERALVTMYLSAECYRNGQDYDPLLAATPDSLAETRIHPRIFVARSWTPVWTGQRPALFGRMLQRARLRFDLSSAQSLAFVLWASVSPKSLRFLLSSLTKRRNRLAAVRIGDRAWVQWKPRPERLPPPPSS